MSKQLRITRSDAVRALHRERLWRGQYFFPQGTSDGTDEGDVTYPGACCAVGAILRGAGYRGENNTAVAELVARTPLLRELSSAFERCTEASERKEVAARFVAERFPDVLDVEVLEP